MGVKERRDREERLRLEAILAAAENVFARRGYRESRMDDIAAEAELSKGAIYYYFRSKDEIFARLIEIDSQKMLAAVRSRIPDHLTFNEALGRLVASFLDYGDINRGFMRMIIPSMGGFVRFGDPEIVHETKKSLETFEMFIRETLGGKIRREGLSFKTEDLQMLLKALHFGIGVAVLDGRKDEAAAAARSFLDLARRAVPAAAVSSVAGPSVAEKSLRAEKRKKSARSSSNKAK